MQHTKEYYVQWRAKNKEQVVFYQRDWNTKNRKRVNESARKRYYSNLEENRSKRRENNIKRRKEILNLLGNKCFKCRFDNWQALQVDHRNGGGSKDRTSYGHSASALYKDIKNNPGKYQLLCANCNWIKRYEGKECFK